ncbi:MAG TPA: TerC family protein [Gemmatimonadaceae bacterium]|jgi:tellurite resistance protein TerC|nr:TerC family protein [Gemmatimonadaceae bacterium]
MTIATNPWFWIGFIAFILVMLALDLGVFHRDAHVVRPREAAAWTGVWVALALLFAAGLHYFEGAHSALTFLTGYVLEESLSADNIFVIVVIFGYFSVPRQHQHRVLFYGILGALVMRGLFIAVGALLLARFHWILYVFGGMLVITGVRMGLAGDTREFDGEKNPVVRFVRRMVPVSARYDGSRFFTVENGRRLATPLLLVLVLVEFTDLLFAVDSIPAIFGVTRDPFLVFTSNIFAVMGLRSLFFLLASVVDRFHLLKYGLSVILTLIGVKMLAARWVEVPTWMSLAGIVAVLAVSIAASLAWPAHAPEGAGRPPGPRGA